MAQKTFHLTVARIGENLFDGEALSVSLPGAEGVLEVLAQHEPLVTELVPGEIRIVAADGTRRHIELGHRGVAEISENQATILM